MEAEKKNYKPQKWYVLKKASTGFGGLKDVFITGPNARLQVLAIPGDVLRTLLLLPPVK